MRRLSASRMLIVVTLVAFALLMVGGTGWAAPVPSQTTLAASAQTPSADTVKAERALVQGALVTYGLTQEEAKARVDLLTDAEVHALTADLDSVQAGGVTTLTTTEILLIIIVVILLVD